MPASIGVNLRVTGHCRQGGRKYMEDFFSVAYQQTEDEKDLEYAFFGIYDGHGGAEAAAFAKEHLMETIIKHKNFWSDYDEDVLRAIKDGYIATHYAMWKEQEKWPRTASGLPSTAGTTASVAFIRRGKIYIGHVGDSGIILGYQEPGSAEWKAKPLTRDHKPENAEEMSRIEQCGGKVVSKSGVPRVVWNRPKIGHQGPVRRSTPIDEIPFLAVARSLGDLWSYNSQINEFIVSPDPDCSVFKIDTNVHRCLIFGTDGLYNMLSPMMAVHIVQLAERHNENAALSDSSYKTWVNPSKLLVERALERWHATKMRADNTSVVTLMLDPPGPPRAQVLKDRKKNLPERGLRIMTRFDSNNPQENNPSSNCDNPTSEETTSAQAQTVLEQVPEPVFATPELTEEPLVSDNSNTAKEENKTECSTSTPESTPVSSSDLISNFPLKERNFLPKPRESTSFDPRELTPRSNNTGNDNGKENLKASQTTEDRIQCNEISSSNIEVDSTCEDENVDSINKNNKHNLRSAKKAKNDSPSKNKPNENGTSPKGTKRKLETGKDRVQPRKSVRLDHNQKKVEEAVESGRKASEAEEKLKKLAERADLAKKHGTTTTQKLSLAQKILKSKNISLKKKPLVKKQITRKRIQMVLETVKKSTTIHKPSTSSLKIQPVVAKETKNEGKKVEKVRGKVITTKVNHFQRRLKKNASQRQRNVKVQLKLNKKPLGNVKSDMKDKNKNGSKVKEQTLDKVKNKTSGHIVISPKKNLNSGSSSSGDFHCRSLRSSTNKAEDTKENDVNISTTKKTSQQIKKKPKMKEPIKVKTLRKRIQQKTESLRSVLRSKSK